MNRNLTTHLKAWSWRAAALLVLAPAVLAIACTGADRPDSGDDPLPNTGQTPPVPTQPSGPGAGDKPEPGLPVEVRDVVTAFVSGGAALGDVLTLSQIPCAVGVEGMGAPPPCPAGTANGQLIAAFPFGVCEGSYLYPHNYRDFLVGRFSGSTFYAAYERTDEGTSTWPKGSVAAILTAPGSDNWGFTVGIENGKVVNLTFGCGATAAQIAGFANDRGPWLVEPAS